MNPKPKMTSSPATRTGGLLGGEGSRVGWVLPPPLSNSWMMNIIWLYTANNRSPNMSHSLNS